MKMNHRVHTTLRFAVAACCVVLAVALTGCGGSDTEEAGDAAPADSAPVPGGTPAEIASVSQGGSGIIGAITFKGPRPERVVLDTGSEPKCTVMHEDDPLLSDREIVGPNGGIKDVFVYIKNPPEAPHTPPAQQAVLDQIGCRYIPHVLGVMVGQEISVRNSDPMLHNVRAFARTNRAFNNSQPEGSAPRIKKFDKAEMAIRLKCDIHPWMTAFVFAMDHPYFAVSDENGSFAIHGMPEGEYTVVAWHEKYGEQETTVSFMDGKLSEADFTFEATQ